MQITAYGQTKTTAAWRAEHLCVVSDQVVRDRMAAGWTAERAMSTPAEKRRKMVKGRKSGYRGVYWNRNAWVAQVRVGGKLIHLGRFDGAGEAAMAYNEGAKRWFGADAKSNEV